MKLEFKLEKENFINFKVNDKVNSKWFKKAQLIYFIFVLLICSLLYLTEAKTTYIMIATVILIIEGVFFKPIQKPILKKRLEKDYEKQEFLYLFEKNEIELKEDCIELISLSERREIPFNSILSLNAIDNYLNIVLKNKNYISIPLKSFKLKEDENKFISFLESKINKKVVKSYPGAIL